MTKRPTTRPEDHEQVIAYLEQIIAGLEHMLEEAEVENQRLCMRLNCMVEQAPAQEEGA